MSEYDDGNFDGHEGHEQYAARDKTDILVLTLLIAAGCTLFFIALGGLFALALPMTLP